MNWIKRIFPLMVIALLFALVSCNTGTTVSTVAAITPTKEFTGKNSFGDGFIAHIPIDTSPSDPQEIVRVLVTQWLEHYKAGTTQPMMMVNDYKINDIRLGEKTADDPTITAGVDFSVVPAEVPNNTSDIPRTIWYGSLLHSREGSWWRLILTFNVYERDQTWYWLRMVTYGG